MIQRVVKAARIEELEALIQDKQLEVERIEEEIDDLMQKSTDLMLDIEALESDLDALIDPSLHGEYDDGN